MSETVKAGGRGAIQLHLFRDRSRLARQHEPVEIERLRHERIVAKENHVALRVLRRRAAVDQQPARPAGIERPDVDGPGPGAGAVARPDGDIQEVAAVGQEERIPMQHVTRGLVERRHRTRRATRRRHAVQRRCGGRREQDHVVAAPRARRVERRRATTTGEPPAGSTVFSCPCAMNAIRRESGDQNGDEAPSVPASGTAASESSGRIQSI